MSNIQFIEENKTKAKIKVIGIGGCGGNAINTMLDTSLEGEVGLYAVNTDAQALEKLREGCERIQIGQQVAKGLGVGANYEKARQAAEQDMDRLEEIVAGADMVFIAAGMGGGTGTGAAPVVAELCRDKGILTVAVVTKPFVWENRQTNTEAGISMLSKCTDSIIMVPNDRICEVYGEDISAEEAFFYSDSILSNAVAGICEIIYKSGRINVDFADVKTVMSEMGQAMMGTATEEGMDRAARVAKEVISCPLLEGIELSNAHGLLVNITANEKSFKMSELKEIMEIIKATASSDSKVFFGMVHDPSMEERLRITLVATGLNRSGFASGGGSVRNLGAPGGGSRNFSGPVLSRTNRGQKMRPDQASLLGEDDYVPPLLRKQHN